MQCYKGVYETVCIVWCASGLENIMIELQAHLTAWFFGLEIVLSASNNYYKLMN